MRKHRCQLDISVGMPGPHDFAVRLQARPSGAPKRPPHCQPNVRDGRVTSLFAGGQRGEVVKVICPTTQAGKFFAGGLDNPNQLESAQEIAF
jgi:hypothetical protein